MIHVTHVVASCGRRRGQRKRPQLFALRGGQEKVVHGVIDDPARRTMETQARHAHRDLCQPDQVNLGELVTGQMVEESRGCVERQVVA